MNNRTFKILFSIFLFIKRFLFNSLLLCTKNRKCVSLSFWTKPPDRMLHTKCSTRPPDAVGRWGRIYPAQIWIHSYTPSMKNLELFNCSSSIEAWNTSFSSNAWWFLFKCIMHYSRLFCLLMWCMVGKRHKWKGLRVSL